MLWAVGMFCIFGWDWLINLPHEIERIWKRKFTYITWLYLATRYYGLVKNAFNIVLITRPITGVITHEQCLTIYKWQPVSALISIQLTQWILGLRVYALYGKNPYVAAGLLTIMAAEFGVQVKTMTVVFPIPEPPGVTLPCIAIGPQEWLVAFWCMPLLFDFVVFSLTLAKSFMFWRRDVHSRTIRAFFRDGVIYFFGIFTMNLLNVTIFLTQDSTLQAVNLPATLMLNIMLACRLVLNLRAPSKIQTLPGSNNSGFTGMGDSTVNDVATQQSSFKMDPMSTQTGSQFQAVRIATFTERTVKGDSMNGHMNSHWVADV